MTFSQEPTSFRLQNSDEIPDKDQCIILVALLGREPTFGALVGQFLDPALTQFWCSLGTCGTFAGIDDESVISPKLLP